MKHDLNIFYLNPVSLGGTATFTAHLIRGLQYNNINCRLIRVGSRKGEFVLNKTKSFGYGLRFVVVSLDTAKRIASNEPSLVTSTTKSKEYTPYIEGVLGAGSSMVVHDPVDLKQGWDHSLLKKAFGIRPTMKNHVKHCTILKHPYDAKYKTYEKPTGELLAVSICRIDFRKNIHILLDANRLLGIDKIQIRGSENRLYTKTQIMPHYPEWKQSDTKYSNNFRAAVDLCHYADFTCDMTVIKGDGGGTQYAFLEAIDAGSCLIVHKQWLLQGGEMKEGENCLSVDNGKDLAELLLSYKTSKELQQKVEYVRKTARELLNVHRADVIGYEWKQELKL